MIYGLIKKNTYQDSVNLMLLSSKLSSMEGIEKVSIMMGTPANKDIFMNTGMYVDYLEEAGPNDICIVVDTINEELVSVVAKELDSFIKEQSSSSSKSKIRTSRTLDGALKYIEDANLALISVPGEYAAQEANRALDRDMNVFMFSDNVSLEDERQLKEKAQDKGLIVMGPDCGTGIISSIPLAFANVVEKGNIGIIGASGTGIQEVSTIISRNNFGISHAIGLGGRDLSEHIGAISAIKAIEMLNNDDSTDVIVFISKPPAPAIRDKVVEILNKIDKKVVAIFIGEKPKENTENIVYTWTLEETAKEAIRLAQNSPSRLKEIVPNIDTIKENSGQRKIAGLYCGGTLAAEAAMIIRDYYGIEDDGCHEDGFMLKYDGHEIIDFGDDKYTKGRPHPMIDPSTRVDAIKSISNKDDVAVVLLDNVIGYGSNEDMAGAIAPAIKEVINEKNIKKQEIVFVASVCGTEQDPQIYTKQVETLEEAGVIVVDNNAQATFTTINIIKYLEKANKVHKNVCLDKNIVNSELNVINIGLEKFSKTIENHNGNVVQYNWSPVAGGDKKLQRILEKLRSI